MTIIGVVEWKSVKTNCRVILEDSCCIWYYKRNSCEDFAIQKICWKALNCKVGLAETNNIFKMGISTKFKCSPFYWPELYYFYFTLDLTTKKMITAIVLVSYRLPNEFDKPDSCVHSEACLWMRLCSNSADWFWIIVSTAASACFWHSFTWYWWLLIQTGGIWDFINYHD